MKKLIFAFALVLGAVSCSTKTTDTTVTDSTVDSVEVVDSITTNTVDSL